MVRILTDDDVASVLELADLVPVVADAFGSQRLSAVERPERPHYPIGVGLAAPDDAGDEGDSELQDGERRDTETADAGSAGSVESDDPVESTGTGLCMPAYIHGAAYAVTKLVTVCPANPDRGLPTVTAQIALTDARTGQPVGYLAGNRITNARTGCIGGLAARELAVDEPVSLTVIGAGTQARWQSRSIAATTDLESIRVYSPSDSKVTCATALEDELDVPTAPVSTPVDAVDGATVVVSATTSSTPVFPGDALDPGTLVIAVGAYTADTRELDARTIERASRVFADVPTEARETGDLRHWSEDELAVRPFGDVLAGTDGRRGDDEILVVSSVGTAVLDAAAAEYVLDRAIDSGAGQDVSL